MKGILKFFKKGVKNPRRASYFLSRKIYSPGRNLSIYFNSRSPLGSNIFDYDWDMLIILDTCRPDALRKLELEYDFIKNVGSHWSVGAQSAEWMANTFDKSYSEEIKETAYISANPHFKSVFKNRLEEHWKSNNYSSDISRLNRFGNYNFVDPEEFGRYEELWKYSRDFNYPYCPPRPVTDRGITVSREYDFDRIILHYMPPHGPYPDNIIPKENRLKGSDISPFAYLRKTGDNESVYNAYLATLKWALDDIKLLLNNVDHDRVVITADHGEAFGENWVIKHPAGSLHRSVRKVPWTVTSATNSKSYSPEFSLEIDGDHHLQDSLKALGYL